MMLNNDLNKICVIMVQYISQNNANEGLSLSKNYYYIKYINENFH